MMAAAMPRLLSAVGGFLFAVLWMDLMFDVQVLPHAERATLPPEVLESIAAYYQRVTTDSGWMSRLIGGVMLTGIAAALHQLLLGHASLARRVASLLLLAVPVGLAAARVFPNAVRLGTRADSVEVRSELARSICYDHLFCLVAIVVFTALHLTSAREPARRARPAV